MEMNGIEKTSIHAPECKSLARRCILGQSNF